MYSNRLQIISPAGNQYKAKVRPGQTFFTPKFETTRCMDHVLKVPSTVCGVSKGVFFNEVDLLPLAAGSKWWSQIGVFLFSSGALQLISSSLILRVWEDNFLSTPINDQNIPFLFKAIFTIPIWIERRKKDWFYPLNRGSHHCDGWMTGVKDAILLKESSEQMS